MPTYSSSAISVTAAENWAESEITETPQIMEMSRVTHIMCPNVKPINNEQIALINIEIIVNLARPILSEMIPPTTQPIPPAIPIEIKEKNAGNQ